MKCPVCGRENYDPNNFCYNCGYCLNSSLKSLKHMRRDRSSYFAVIILLVLIIAGLIGTMVHFGLKYRDMISENRAVKAEQVKTQEAYDEIMDRVYVPNDGSYLYHHPDCSALDPSVPCFIMDEDDAIQYGCAPCPECMK